MTTWRGAYYSTPLFVLRVGLGALAVVAFIVLALWRINDALHLQQTMSHAALARRLALWVGGPLLLTALLDWGLRVVLQRRGEVLSIRGAAEASFQTQDGVLAWAVPLGTRVGWRARLGGVACWLVGRGTLPARMLAASRQARAVAAFEEARSMRPRWRWLRRLVRHLLFPALIAVQIFHLQQHIGYGGLFGQYRLEGLGPYVLSYLRTYAVVLMHMNMYVIGLWAVASTLCAAATVAKPLYARRWRRALGVIVGMLYYVGVPAGTTSQINY